VGRLGTALAAILLFWQMPHFFAIGWQHRADYRAAGFRLLPGDGRSRRGSFTNLP
jgi:protoheme IX farnesyltransferase